jgi:VanZ family protein
VRTPLQVHGALSRGAFAVVVLLSLAVLFAPPSDVPSAPPGVDKIVHALLFLALAFSGRWAGTGQALLGGALVAYAVVSEIVQGQIGRDAAWGDLVADVLGLAVGLVLWRLATGRATPG